MEKQNLMLDVDGLTTHYLIHEGTVKAAENVNFYIDQGEVFGLAGESGCGKTTVAISIMKLLPYEGKIIGGRVILDGEDLVAMGEEEMRGVRWKKVSMVFQGAMNALNPVFTVGKQIVEAIQTHEDVSKSDAWSRAKELFGLVGLDPGRIKEYSHEFSGGMRQRVMIAMALACNPKLIIADEPVTALDVVVQGQVLDLMKKLQKELNLSTMLITHDLSVIAETCDRTAIMYAGRLVEFTDTVALFKEPLHPYTYGLIGAYPSIIGERKRLNSITGRPPNLINPPPGCRFHPRCPFAEEVCSNKVPEFVEVKKRHYVACHITDEWNMDEG